MLNKALKQRHMAPEDLSDDEVVKADDAVTAPGYEA